MNSILRFTTALGILLVMIICGCSNETKSINDKEIVSVESEKGEHARDVGEKGEGEEDGTQLGLGDVYDVVRNGAHLVLSFDALSNSFTGVVENTTEGIIKKVRVEVHLSNGIELSPTTPVDLKPGEKVAIELKATEKAFETWSTHAEVGESEHGSEHGGEHGGEGEGEHGDEGEGEHN